MLNAVVLFVFRTGENAGMVNREPSQPSPAPSEETLYEHEVEEVVVSRETAHDADTDIASPLSSATVGQAVRLQDHRLQEFLNASDVRQAVECWLGRPLSIAKDTAEALARKLNRDVAVIDGLLNRQLNAVLHHPRFQRLEASWRGISLLVDVQSKESNDYDQRANRVKVKLLDVSWKELEDDFTSAGYVEQSATFEKVYEQEFGTYGGEPFGLLIGDYEVNNESNGTGTVDDIFVMENMSAVAASAFSPFVANASPKMLDLDDFSQLDEISDLSLHDDIRNVRWNRLIEKEDARFLGLCMPRILMRRPYGDRPDYPLEIEHHRDFRESSKANQFCFREEVRGRDSSRHLWGGAAYAYATVVLRSFCRTGWLTEIRGVDRQRDGGGLVTELPVDYYEADRAEVCPRPVTDGVVTDALENDLADMGLIPLCSIYGSSGVAFYSGVSIQRPRKYDSEVANANARLSSMLHNILCVSRFAHYLKKIGRESVGRFTDSDQIQHELATWIGGFVTSDSSASPSAKAQYPLFDADVQVRPIRGKAGEYVAIFDLQPHYEIEGLKAGIRLKTEL